MGRPSKSVTSCQTALDFRRTVRRQGGLVESGRKHDIARSPSGRGRVAIPRHRGDLDPNTRSNIRRALLALGFSAFLCVPVGCAVRLVLGLIEMYG